MLLARLPAISIPNSESSQSPHKVGINIAVLQVRHLRLNQANLVGVLIVSPSMAEWILAPGFSDLRVVLNHDKSRLPLAGLLL